MAGKIAAARFPLGPNRKDPFAWDDIWGWAIPKSISPERKKLAKEMLAAMMVDKEGQMKMFKATGAPPPNTTFWPEIAAADPFMKLLKESVLDSPYKVRGAYYFANWPAVHKAFNDTVTKAVTGKREDIAKVLAEGAPIVSKAAQ
jgi:ABC-type glycerol-3-phosphate transport system substrate-binding protein